MNKSAVTQLADEQGRDIAERNYLNDLWLLAMVRNCLEFAEALGVSHVPNQD